MRAQVLEPTLMGRRFEVMPEQQPRRSVAHLMVWTTFAVVALLLMEVLDLTVYGVVIPVAGVLLALVTAQIGPSNPSIAWMRLAVDRADVIAIVALYVVTVALFRLAFGVFGTDRVAGLFLSFAPAATAFGVIAMYATVIVLVTSWIRKRIGTTWWRRLHLFAVPAFVLSLAHGVFSGTDSARPWMWWMYLLTGSLVVFIVVLRGLTAGYRPERATRQGATEHIDTAGRNVTVDRPRKSTSVV